jgi:hypothetical protein
LVIARCGLRRGIVPQAHLVAYMFLNATLHSYRPMLALQ